MSAISLRYIFSYREFFSLHTHILIFIQHKKIHKQLNFEI